MKTAEEIKKEDRLWTVRDVASYLQVSRSWVYAKAECGELPCLPLGRTTGRRAMIRFDPTEVKAFARGETPRKVVPFERKSRE